MGKRGRPKVKIHSRWCKKCGSLFKTDSKYKKICLKCGGGKRGGTGIHIVNRKNRHQTSTPYWKRLILYGTTKREEINP